MAYQYPNSAYPAYSQPTAGQYGQQSSYPTAPGYAAATTQPQAYGVAPAQYDQTPPQIRNPFAPPVSAYSEHNATFDPNGEQQAAAWSAAYAPAEPQPEKHAGGKKGKGAENANYAPLGQRGGGGGAAVGPAAPGEHHTGAGDASSASAASAAAAIDDPEKSNLTVRRKGGGETWEDKTLLEWDPTQFRIMVGNLAGEVTDDSLAKAFAPYGVAKARVVREKRTTKSKGYGFVSFTDGEQGFRAAREMVGKYIGSHPVTIQRSKTQIAPVVVKDRRNQGGHHHKNRGKQQQGKFGGSGGGGGGQHEQKQSHQPPAHDPLKAHTGAGVQKKSAKPHLKLLG